MIWFVGDQHTSFGFIAEAIDQVEVKPDAVILLGDMECPHPLAQCMAGVTARGVDWFWIIGNHDTDLPAAYENLQGALDRCLDGRTVEIAGLRVAGLGGIFRGKVWHPEVNGGVPLFRNFDQYASALRRERSIKQRLKPSDQIHRDVAAHGRVQVDDLSRDGQLRVHRSTIFPDVYDGLGGERADILVSHEAPAVACAHGFEEIDGLARAMGVSRVVHGHHHFDGRASGDVFEVFSVGQCGIVDQDGKVIRAGEA